MRSQLDPDVVFTEPDPGSRKKAQNETGSEAVRWWWVTAGDEADIACESLFSLTAKVRCVKLTTSEDEIIRGG